MKPSNIFGNPRHNVGNVRDRDRIQGGGQVTNRTARTLEHSKKTRLLEFPEYSEEKT